jgi:hypothetical protein
MAVYQNVGKINNELIFEVQRRSNIIDKWIVKRNTIGVFSSTTSTAYDKNNPSLMGNPKKDATIIIIM